MKYFLIFLLLFQASNCVAWETSDKKTPDETVDFPISSEDEEPDYDLRYYLWYPEDFDAEKTERTYNTVIMAHGCGGAHYKDLKTEWVADYVSGKYKVWGKMLNERDIVVMLVDSFTWRDEDEDVGAGVCNSDDPLDRPEKIDPISVRPADIATGISYIKSRSDFQTDKIGVLGFSNGGTSALVLANHEDLVNRSDALTEEDKTWFDLPFNTEYKADLFVALYPGCGLNGYSENTQGIFDDKFLTYTDTFLFIASDDSSLPTDTKEKCQALRALDAKKSYNYPNMKMKVVEYTDHQFDYYEEDEEPVEDIIDRIIALFESM